MVWLKVIVFDQVVLQGNANDFTGIGHRAAANRHNKICIHSPGVGRCGQHCRARCVRWNTRMNAGDPVTQRTLDTLDLVGVVSQGLADQQKNTLRRETISLFGQGLGHWPTHVNALGCRQ
jgi:hypothetical protein